MDNLDVITPEKIVEIAKEKGEDFSKNIKTNQIRNFYSAINSIRQKANEKAKFKYDEKDEESKQKEENKQKLAELTNQINMEIILLEPKLAYATGRQPAVRGFYNLIKEAVIAYKNVNDNDKDKAVANFIILIESVVAYHKFFGGKDA